MNQFVQHQENHPSTVLIVDDNPTIRNVIAWSLKFGGYQPVEAANGREAVCWMEQAAREHQYPAVILLDIAMPGMNGESFLQWLQSTWPTHYPKPSIIVITAAYGDEHLYNMPVQQIMMKPFRMHDLLAAVRKLAAA